MDNRAIALFDSGIGGLDCVKKIRQLMPSESIIFFGDTLRAPYGDRSSEEIECFSGQIIDFLAKQPIKLVVAACNTVSSICLPKLQMQHEDLPMVGMIHPTVAYAAAHHQGKRIGIIATEAAVRSGVYQALLKKAGWTEPIFTKACPSFVPMIESGITNGPRAEQIITKELEDFLNRYDIQILLLGCTHYPYLQHTISAIYPQIKIIDPAVVVAEYVRERLRAGHMEAAESNPATQIYYTSKLTDTFSWAARAASEQQEPLIILKKDIVFIKKAIAGEAI